MPGKKKGKFWDKDQNGYLINDAAEEKIETDFWPVIDVVKGVILDILTSSCHSIYLTGSIPRGKAVLGKSDLDLFALLHPGFRAEETIKSLQEECRKIAKLQPFARKIDVELWEFSEVFPLAKNQNAIQLKSTLSEYDAILKNSSLCLYGKSVIPFIPPIMPNLALANPELISLNQDVMIATQAIIKDPKPFMVRYWCEKVMKNIIRAGFHLVMPLIEKHTRDIDLSSQVLIHYYPNMKEEVKQAVHWVNHPPDNPREILPFLNDFGNHMIAFVGLWMDYHNPLRKRELPRNAVLDKTKPHYLPPLLL